MEVDQVGGYDAGGDGLNYRESKRNTRDGDGFNTSLKQNQWLLLKY